MSDILLNTDCMSAMRQMRDQSVDFTLTDIPYNKVSRASNGLRRLDFGKADILTFDLEEFCKEVFRVSKNSIVIFCGREQFSKIYAFFAKQKGTTRPIIWQKSNPSPMNGQHIYLSGVELGVWFKRAGAKTFNAHCKNTIFKFPLGSSKLHPTEKNHKLLEDLILDNTNKGELVFDPCAGSGSTCLVAKRLNRHYLGFELDKEFHTLAVERLNKEAMV